MEVAQYTVQSLYVAYRRLSSDAQQAFRSLLAKETEAVSDYENAEWLPLSDSTLRELWGNPEEDYWDELYAKQHPKTEFLQGSIVWAFYPLTDKVDKTKRRPVLIVSNRLSNALDNDCIVLPITKAIRSETFSMIIEPSDVEGDLPVDSELRCNKPFTLRNNLITDMIGVLK